MSLRVGSIHAYPVKSCRGVDLRAARLDTRGIEHDREWMIIDGKKGVFLTQRELPRMALIQTAMTEEGLQMTLPDGESFAFPFDDLTGPRMKASIWMHSCDVIDCGDQVAAALNRFLQPGADRECRLARMAPDSLRPNMMGKGSVALVDAYPIHAISQASLDDLNARLAQPLPMNRFRPNLVFTGCEPYAEDEWKAFRAGGVEFQAEFKCVRCSITTLDQETATAGKEPLATLAGYRKMGKKVVFGGYFTHRAEGEIRVGDAVEVESATPSQE